MQIDKFTKACLLAIVILLTILVVKPVFEARESYAAKTVQYEVVDSTLNPDNANKVLNEQAKNGWELVAVSGDGGYGMHYIFKR
ncbi:MAG: DUF4177 domain-containing protein [Deltaproteobacteria bacterium]|nr:DUF4177 domain-containing protein [Deltaproteobacteria bacterium]